MTNGFYDNRSNGFLPESLAILEMVYLYLYSRIDIKKVEASIVK